MVKLYDHIFISENVWVVATRLLYCMMLHLESPFLKFLKIPTGMEGIWVRRWKVFRFKCVSKILQYYQKANTIVNLAEMGKINNATEYLGVLLCVVQ